MIELNYIEMTSKPNSFKIFISDNLESENRDDSMGRHSLKINGSYQKRIVSFDQFDGFQEFNCELENNRDVSKKYFLYVLNKTLNKSDLGFKINYINKKFSERIEIIIDEQEKGFRTVNLIPYYLKANHSYGFLIRYKFKLKENETYDIEAQKLALSVDKNGRSNKNYYTDIHRIIIWTINKFITSFNESNIFDFTLSTKLTVLKKSSLNKKEYLFRNSIPNNSQFNGVRLNGPYSDVGKHTKFIFVFEDKFKDFSNTLYKSLLGKLFSTTFSGMKSMFGVNLSMQDIRRVAINGYEKSDIIAASEKIINIKKIEFPENSVIVIFIEPSSEFNLDYSPYYLLKLLLTNQKIPLQVINHEKLSKKNVLKWATSSIGLQIFSKLGGVPWIVKPSNSNCLILGIGSSHEFLEDRKMKKYFTYSVCLDSSGVYKKLAVLSKTENETNHIDNLKSNLVKLLQSQEFSHYKKCALHLPFKIKNKEIQSIKEALMNFENVEFKVIKVNLKNKFFGFSSHNSKVPYESNFIKLSPVEYLVWFEGLQYGKENIYQKTGNPVHVQFLDNGGEIDIEKDRRYLQDVINLSGANWRGFNAKLMPISIYYSQIVAEYTKEFEKFEDFDNEIFQYSLPWFL